MFAQMMTAAEAHWWLNLAALIGIAILAVPTWSLNKRKKNLQSVRKTTPQKPDSFRASVKAILTDKHNRDVADWRRIDEICLIAGYLLLLGSAFLRLFMPLSA
jgi:hypothetical protein